MSEWLKEHAWKVCIQETVSRVRISPSPPNLYLKAPFLRGFFVLAVFCSPICSPIWISRSFFPGRPVDVFRCKPIYRHGVWYLHRFELQVVFSARVLASAQINLSLTTSCLNAMRLSDRLIPFTRFLTSRCASASSPLKGGIGFHRRFPHH